MALKGISPLTGDEMVVFDLDPAVCPEEFSRLVEKYESNTIKLLKEKFHTATHFPGYRAQFLYRRCQTKGRRILLVSVNHRFWVTTLNFSFYRTTSKDAVNQIIEAIEVSQNHPNLNPVDYLNGKRDRLFER